MSFAYERQTHNNSYVTGDVSKRQRAHRSCVVVLSNMSLAYSKLITRVQKRIHRATETCQYTGAKLTTKGERDGVQRQQERTPKFSTQILTLLQEVRLKHQGFLATRNGSRSGTIRATVTIALQSPLTVTSTANSVRFMSNLRRTEKRRS